MRMQSAMTATISALLAIPVISAPIPTQMVITARPTPTDDRSISLEPGNMTVLRSNTPERILRLERLTGAFGRYAAFRPSR